MNFIGAIGAEFILLAGASFVMLAAIILSPYIGTLQLLLSIVDMMAGFIFDITLMALSILSRPFRLLLKIVAENDRNSDDNNLHN